MARLLRSRGIPQSLRTRFRQRGINIHTRAQFEPRALVDSRDDRNIPVEMSRVLFLGPERSNDEIEGGIAQHAVNLSQDCPQCYGKVGQSFDGLLLEVSRVRLGKDPQVLRGEGGIGDEGHEIVALGDNSATMCSLL
jgi:hypothetical protein